MPDDTTYKVLMYLIMNNEFLSENEFAGYGYANTGVNPSFMNVQTTAVFAENFEHGVPPKIFGDNRQGLVIRQNRVDL
jgi:hypothetical protein